MQCSRVALVVEDDPAFQATVKRHLEATQFRVLASFDYRTALRHLETEVPDIVLVDLGLPNESGYELCEHIRRRPGMSLVPIVLTSERTFPDDMARAEEAGANAFLRKPFSMERLTAAMAMLLADGPPKSQRWMRRLR
jgi:two-component system chemotaxis response regulator CheY